MWVGGGVILKAFFAAKFLLKIILLISQPKRMLWVLIRTVSLEKKIIII